MVGLYLSLGAIFLGGIVTVQNEQQSLNLEIRDVPEKFLDQINVGHDHSPAAVPSAAKLVHSIAVKELISQGQV